MSATTTADKVRALHDRLVAQVEALVTGEDWARYLSVAARFHTYSANNLWLILAQRPDLGATGGRVAGWPGSTRGGSSAAASTGGPRASPYWPPASIGAGVMTTRRRRRPRTTWPP